MLRPRSCRRTLRRHTAQRGTGRQGSRWPRVRTLSTCAQIIVVTTSSCPSISWTVRDVVAILEKVRGERAAEHVAPDALGEVRLAADPVKGSWRTGLVQVIAVEVASLGVDLSADCRERPLPKAVAASRQELAVERVWQSTQAAPMATSARYCPSRISGETRCRGRRRGRRATLGVASHCMARPDSSMLALRG